MGYLLRFARRRGLLHQIGVGEHGVLAATLECTDSRNCQICWVHIAGFCLNADLAKLRFHFACQPDFIEHSAVEFGNGRFVGIGDAFPAVGL